MSGTASVPAGFGIDVSRVGDCAVVTVSGEVDMYAAPPLWDRLDAVIRAGVRDVVLDLRHLEFIDSSGISVLVKVMMRLRDQNGDLTLRSVSPRTYKVLEVTGLTRVISVHGSAAQGASVTSP